MILLSAIASVVGAEWQGEDRNVAGMAPLDQAGPDHLSFLMPGRTPATNAGVLLLREQDQGDYAGICLFVDNPYLAFAKASALFDVPWHTQSGIHPSAQVDPTAILGEGVQLDAGVVVGGGTHIGAGCFVGANSVIGPQVEMGAGCHIAPQVVLYRGVTLGTDVRIHSGAIIGADGFGNAQGPNGWQKIHQLGGVRIGDRVEIGANTTIDRGALADTIVEDGVKIDNQVMVAHNCSIGENTAIAACVGMAGSTRIGKNCTVAGAAGFTGHLQVCDNVHIGAMTLVAGDIRTAGTYAGGVQGARPMGDWKRNVARFNQLDQLAKRLIALEKKTSL